MLGGVAVPDSGSWKAWALGAHYGVGVSPVVPAPPREGQFIALGTAPATPGSFASFQTFSRTISLCMALVRALWDHRHLL